MARDFARQAMEVELKLGFDPADTGRIASHRALDPGLAPPEEQELVTTYFDTQDCALHRAGVYLRIRENGGRYVQTVKTAKNKADLLQRLEWEREIPSRTIDLDGVAGSALEPLLTPELSAALQPVFKTRITRRLCRIEQDGSEIEVAIDRGEIATRSQTRPISELELELKRGERTALFQLARRLAETIPLRLEVKTKADRGYELLQDGGHQAEKAAEIDIAPDMPAGEAFRAIAFNCLRQIMANEPSMSAGQPEALHQMRIGLRRSRAAIAVFGEIVDDDDLETDQGRTQMDHAGTWPCARSRCVRGRGSPSVTGKPPRGRSHRCVPPRCPAAAHDGLCPRRRRRPVQPFPRRHAHACRMDRDRPVDCR